MCDLFALFVRKKNIVCGFWPWPMPNRVNNRILTNESIVTFSWNSSKTGNFDRCANLHLGELLTRVRFELNTFFLFYRNFCNAFFPICFFIALDEIVSSFFFLLLSYSTLFILLLFECVCLCLQMQPGSFMHIDVFCLHLQLCSSVWMFLLFPFRFNFMWVMMEKYDFIVCFPRF